MSWCDKLAATPTIGLRLDPSYTPSDALLSSIRPLLNEWGQGEKPDFTLDNLEPFSATVQLNNGFAYTVDPSRISIVFQHRMKVRTVSGGLPTVELISSPQPYTELLEEAQHRLLVFSKLLPDSGRRFVRRIGVVVSVNLDEEELPPGIAKMISYLSKPWPGETAYFNFNLVGNIDVNQRWTDRCVHTAVKQEEPDALVNIKFDWQRTFATEQPYDTANLKKDLDLARKAALAYFEELAEGNRFDEHVSSDESPSGEQDE
jgi:hypothetical protein